jgi:hypothetical protein
MLAMLGGSMILCYGVSNFVTIVANLDTSRTRFKAKFDQLNDWFDCLRH